MSISVRLEAFEGPLDLLLHLIDKNKIDIYDIPITVITEQYLEYINNADYKDLDSMSEFLVMASELISIKSKMLLPKDETQEDDCDPRYELVERLLEFKMFKYVSSILKDREEDASKNLFKDPTVPEEIKNFKEELDPYQILNGISLASIQKTFLSLMKKQVDKIDPIRSKFGEIEKEKINLSDKINYISKYASYHRIFSFTDLLSEECSKQELIVTFLGILELTKTGQVIVKQNTLFDNFTIIRLDNKKNTKDEISVSEAVLNGN
ncbi:MAG: segregation/condensation protein A [Clostridiales bacterium]|nr:segregation/condensation protein A [Clostridiales bacterium]